MNAIEVLRQAQSAALTDEDGQAVVLELAPALPAGEIDALQARIGLPLPRELRALLGFCSGVDGCLDGIDFTGASMSFQQADVFPSGLPIAADGFGNFWVLDLTPDTTDTAPVFFACHDAPVILHQSPDLASFLAEVVRMFVPPHTSLVNDVHDDRVLDVWGKNPGVLDHQAAAASPDPVVSAFATSLAEDYYVIDLRSAKPGMGFSWGRFGPRTLVRRHGYERVFAYAKPPKRGLLQRLLGR